ENGQEEAPQAAAEDTRTAAEQEVTRSAPSDRPSGRSSAGAGPGAGRDSARGARARRPRGTPGTGGTVRQLTAVASGILRDAAAAGASRSTPARRARSWLATEPAAGGNQAALPWNGGN